MKMLINIDITETFSYLPLYIWKKVYEKSKFIYLSYGFFIVLLRHRFWQSSL